LEIVNSHVSAPGLGTENKFQGNSCIYFDADWAKRSLWIHGILEVGSAPRENVCIKGKGGNTEKQIADGSRGEKKWTVDISRKPIIGVFAYLVGNGTQKQNRPQPKGSQEQYWTHDPSHYERKLDPVAGWQILRPFAKREAKTLGQFSGFLFGPVGIKLLNEPEILGGCPALPEHMDITDIADIEFPLRFIEVVQPPEYLYFSGIGSQQSYQALNECRLARTIWPNQTENHTGIEIKVDRTELKILECLHHILALAGNLWIGKITCIASPRDGGQPG
jgi:hypothetical protein